MQDLICDGLNTCDGRLKLVDSLIKVRPKSVELFFERRRLNHEWCEFLPNFEEGSTCRFVERLNESPNLRSTQGCVDGDTPDSYPRDGLTVVRLCGLVGCETTITRDDHGGIVTS
jgi:hypothetical protein